MGGPLYSTRPLSDRTWLRPHSRRVWSQFSVPWSRALEVLGYEVEQLRGRDLVIEVDVAEADLRLDGRLRANARAASPAVVVAFESKHGPLLYRSDRYAGLQWSTTTGMGESWQHNVYAAALTLEALRAVDRYGATQHAEQYAGWRQIGSGPAIVPDAPMDRRDAAGLLIAWAYSDAAGYTAMRDQWIRDLLSGTGPHEFDVVARRAQRNAHPDTTTVEAAKSGDAFDQVQRAIAVLRGAR